MAAAKANRTPLPDPVRELPESHSTGQRTPYPFTPPPTLSRNLQYAIKNPGTLRIWTPQIPPQGSAPPQAGILPARAGTSRQVPPVQRVARRLLAGAECIAARARSARSRPGDARQGGGLVEKGLWAARCDTGPTPGPARQPGPPPGRPEKALPGPARINPGRARNGLFRPARRRPRLPGRGPQRVPDPAGHTAGTRFQKIRKIRDPRRSAPM